MRLPLPSPLPAIVNHLLAAEPWARQKLALHAGKVACIDAGIVKMRLKATADGFVESVTEEDQTTVTIRVNLSDVPRILQDRERAFSYVRIEGDADFANTISQLGQSLRWEAEEDLSRLIGDIAATRVVAAARGAFDTARTTQQKLAENVAEYFLEENPMLVRPPEVSDFTAEIVRLRDDVERLAKRIDKLGGRR